MSHNTILITGGGSGIGRALAEKLHQQDNKVIIAGRNTDKLKDVCSANSGMEWLQLDMTNSHSIRDFSEQMMEKYPELNVAILNAGIMKPEDIGDDDIETAKDIIATNLTGQIELNSRLLPLLKKNKNSVIMTVTSGLAFLPRADFPTYCATKAAIHSYTQSLRTQLVEDNIQVIELEPPYTQTELTRPEQASDPKAMPLDEFISETMDLLKNGGSDLREIQVERVKFQRMAEASGEYDKRYVEFQNRFGILNI